jgi:glycyl-tRNA synthetase beta chain
MRDFLLEIGSEELPASVQPSLSEALANQLTAKLKQAGLTHGAVQTFATPRRTAVLIKDLITQQPDQAFERRGPAFANAFQADGTPTKAAEGFARSVGVSVADLKAVETSEGKWLTYQVHQKGQTTISLLPEIIKQAVAALPLAKPMRWGDGDTAFVRPVHWVVALLGDEIIKGEVFNVKCDRSSYGHRMHAPGVIPLASASVYEDTLLHAFVIADFSKRREQIKNNVSIRQDDLALLDEVTGLVEWPVVMQGSFDKAFLEVPKEALIASMKVHQKCFPVYEATDKLANQFVFVANLEGNRDLIVHGNEKVIAARLADAAFFFQEDKKYKLKNEPMGKKNDYFTKLDTVVFQKGLGSLKDKAERMQAIAGDVVSSLEKFSLGKATKKAVVEQALAEEAALLAKCDLVTTMVGEFPELQGIMGKYYALGDEANKEKAEVAQAIGEQYEPLPKSDLGATLALTDRLDTLVGLFALGQKPTGDKDPFGLRRATLSVLRILTHRGWDFPTDMNKGNSLGDLLSRIYEKYKPPLKLTQFETIIALLDFFKERFRAEYLEKGYAPDLLQAVLTPAFTSPYDCVLRLEALTQFKKLPEAASLAAANKRVSNLLKTSQTGPAPNQWAQGLLKDEAEKQLAAALQNQDAKTQPLIQNKQYKEALQSLAQLRSFIDTFFDNVMVMDQDKEISNNRLNLLGHLQYLFNRIADISLLQS